MGRKKKGWMHVWLRREWSWGKSRWGELTSIDAGFLRMDIYSPIRRSPGSALRRKIIEWLDPYVKACWARMSMWATFPSQHAFREIFEIIATHPQMCIDDVATEVKGCYCGKYRDTGKPGWRSAKRTPSSMGPSDEQA